MNRKNLFGETNKKTLVIMLFGVVFMLVIAVCVYMYTQTESVKPCSGPAPKECEKIYCAINLQSDKPAVDTIQNINGYTLSIDPVTGKLIVKSPTGNVTKTFEFETSGFSKLGGDTYSKPFSWKIQEQGNFIVGGGTAYYAIGGASGSGFGGDAKPPYTVSLNEDNVTINVTSMVYSAV